MRFERLILTSGGHAVSVRFHPRFTVIAGVGPLEREGVTSELLGALRGPRPGTNLELVQDNGRRLAILRPGWGLGDRALDSETGAELTDELTTPDGRLDLLAPLGMSLDRARSLARFSALDLMAKEAQDEFVHELAGHPQGQLWLSADRLIEATRRLDAAATSVGATPEDTTVMAEVDARHAEFERAQDRCDSVRHHGIFTGLACAIAGVPAVLMNRWSAIGFVAVAAIFLGLAVIFRRRMEEARVAEDHALSAAGAASYGGFLHQRVAALMNAQESQRREISAAVTEHRLAQAAWTALVGDIDVRWANQHKVAIAAAAASAGDAEGAALAHALVQSHPSNPKELADLLLERIDALQAAGLGDESLPLILDEPFEGLDADAKHWMLEVLVRAAGHPQVVLLTEDEDIVEWARGEEPVGDLAVVFPAPDRVERELRIAS